MLQEREAWMERRDTFLTLYVGAPTVSNPAAGFMVVPPNTIFSGQSFDLVVVPISVQCEHKRWLEDTLLTRLKSGGRLIIVNDP